MKFTICVSKYRGDGRGTGNWFTIFNSNASQENWIHIHDLFRFDDKYIIDRLFVDDWYERIHTRIDIEFNFWDHMCIGINLETGAVTMVRKGHIMLNKTLEVFKKINLKPQNLAGKVYLGSYGGKSDDKVSNFNVYNNKLSIAEMQEITNGSRCGEQGNYLSWSNSKWNLTDSTAKVQTIEKNELCGDASITYFHGHHFYEDGMHFCRGKFSNSRMHLPRSFKESKMMSDKIEKVFIERVKGSEPENYCGRGSHYWLAGYDSYDERGWIDDNTKQPMTHFQWESAQPNAIEQRCIATSLGKDYRLASWYDTECLDTSCFACESERRLTFSFRGLCGKSRFRDYYTPNNNDDEIQKGLLGYTGFHNVGIRYNSTSFEWNLFMYDYEPYTYTWATSKASQETGALGLHKWLFFNESSSCTDEFTFSTELSFTSCNDEQFNCNDGQCIPMENKCDGRTHCRDRSDEIGCKILVTSSSYSKDMIPLPEEENKKAQMDLSIKINNVLGINEIGQTFHVSYNLILKWIDPRLKYFDIKKNENINVLTEDEKFSIWTPTIVLSNTRSKETVAKDKDTLIKIIANNNFTYTKADYTVLKNVFTFAGKENFIKLVKVKETFFLCTYNMGMYPFDTQTCSLDFLLTETTDDFCELQDGVLQYTGPMELTQYFIKHFYIKKAEVDGRQGVKVFVILGRRLLSNTLTVYLPTILLNMIGHLTVYFKPYFFEVCLRIIIYVIGHALLIERLFSLKYFSKPQY